MTDAAHFAARLDAAVAAASPIPQLTDEAPHLDLGQAYAIQLDGLRLRLARGERRIGVKMGLTSRAKMIQMGVDEVIAGVLTDRMRIDDGGELNAAAFIHPRVEPEIAFRLGRAIGAEVSPADAAAAIDAVAPALEIIDSRYRDFRFKVADVVADNASAAAFVVGPWSPWPVEIADLGMVLELDGRTAAVGTSAAILGHPLRALIAAAKMAPRLCGELAAGDIVLAGAATPAQALTAGAHVRVKVDSLGAASFSIGAAR